MLKNKQRRRNVADAVRIEIALLKTDTLRKKEQKKQSSAGMSKTKGKSDEMLLPKTNKPSPKPVFFELRLPNMIKIGRLC